ncbi:MAG TPA: hypothetical protein VI320_07125 [Terracidiphilus sp.]|jgi:hypothetical protein
MSRTRAQLLEQAAPSRFGPMPTCSGPGSSSGFKDITEREAGFQAGHAGQAGELVLMEAPVIVNAARRTTSM